MDTKDSNKDGSQSTHIVLSFIKWVALTVFGSLGVILVIGLGGYQIPFWPEDTEVTNKKPFSNFIGEQYRLTSELYAHAWNDFPDKEKILVVTLMPPPGHKNRFVSYRLTLQPGQVVRIHSAWRSLSLFEYSYYYHVSIPDAGLPVGIPIQMKVSADGSPSMQYYEHIQSNKALNTDSAKNAVPVSEVVRAK